MAHRYRDFGRFALTLTHQLQLMLTAKPSLKSLSGFGRADLVCLVGTGSSYPGPYPVKTTRWTGKTCTRTAG